MKKIILVLVLMMGSLSADLLNDGIKEVKNGNFKKANKLWTKACDLGNMSACFNLGLLYNNGDGVKQDKSKAKELFGQACDSGHMRSCYNLGILYDNGDGIQQDKKKASELYTKVCDSEQNMGACLNLGVLYSTGEGVRQDKSKAKKLFGKACDDGNYNGCKGYKMLNEQGVK